MHYGYLLELDNYENLKRDLIILKIACNILLGIFILIIINIFLGFYFLFKNNGLLSKVY